jgi:hypothetical protein
VKKKVELCIKNVLLVVQKNQLKDYKMNLIVSQKKDSQGEVLVITDENILGKNFEEGKLQLDLSQKFYQGNSMTKDEVKELLKKTRHAHFTGKYAVAIGVEIELINPKKILYIQNVPHAQVIVE